MGVRVLSGVLALIALFIGVFMWGAPAEFSGAETGDSMECESGVCRIVKVDDSEWGITIVEFSDLPRIVLFEGTEAEALEWTRQEHIKATRPIAIAWLAGAIILGGLAVMPRRSAAGSTQAD